MKFSKQTISSFFSWMRNGIAFCCTWLLLLILCFCRLHGIEMLAVNTLFKLIFFVCGGVVLFCIWFSPLFFKKMRFIGRLSGFFATFTVYELLFFYLSGLFKLTETRPIKLIVFFTIVLALYLFCLLLDRFYFKKKGAQYTQRLNEYLNRRNDYADK